MQLFQLTYQSSSINSITHDDLLAILKTANSINKEHNITGCLVFYEEKFVQILEGREEYVRKIYNKIIQDKRHHSIKLLWECEAKKRLFEDWNMAYYNPTTDTESSFKSNFRLLIDFSDKSQAILLSFWSAVERTLAI